MVPRMSKYTPTIQRLLDDIDSFLAIHPPLTATVFGQRAVNDGHLIRDLRHGKGIGAGRLDRVYAYMRQAAKPPRARKPTRKAPRKVREPAPVASP